MERTTDDALRYVMIVARHIRRDRVQSAILAVLMDLGFSESLDGFGFVREAIHFKFGNKLLRISAIYLMIAGLCGPGTDSDQIDHGIRASLLGAWNLGRIEKWNRIFLPEEGEPFERPTNARFIARIACLMELWSDCCEEEVGCAG